MVSSTFISIGLHVSIIIIAYFGMPSLKIREPIEQPIDIVEDTPISSQTSLKLGSSLRLNIFDVFNTRNYY